MKLRKQTPAKAFIVAATLALLAAFFGLVKSERIQAEAEPPPTTPSVNYDRFFAPGAAPQPSSAPHTRTHAS